ncbi:Cysteine-rich secretory protein family protein [Enhygromyxa salina]|uniref:Cysteine-rich secretory protein family protein n=1 Tax=Enhygromyxa salina TaxID=215803 RepID=A0A2S9XHS1_9BACT|nr:CAP domain-containing protein [Enhygromyxa salina]PRP92387.1 Cysteine-rich secretory protein family protein [Enhygromyxa salina]
MSRRLVPSLALTLVVTLGACASDEGTADEGFPAEDEYNAHCDAQAEWTAEWAQFEAEVVTIVNQRRSEGATCGDESFAATGPVVAEAQLRCAARLHSEDMALRGFFAHTNLDGESPWDRVDKTEYSGNASGENIAQGYPDPAAVMDGWMNSPGHCSNIMNPDNTELGVGFYGDGNYWTQVMGRR